MVLVLTIGDLHIPNRVAAVPLKFRELLVPGKIQRVLCTGNLCDKETEEFLKVICPEIQIVKGDMDDVQSEYPERCVTNVGQLSFGLCHGHQLIPWNDPNSLASLRRDMGVDVLVVGHSHSLKMTETVDGGLIIDPGTATGAPVAYSLEPKRPSFVLLDVQGTKIIAYTYEIYGEDIKVDRVVFERLANTTFQEILRSFQGKNVLWTMIESTNQFQMTMGQRILPKPALAPPSANLGFE